ncbi:MAG: LPS export ABC transporter permease LptG [Pseudomonadota bacterium]
MILIRYIGWNLVKGWLLVLVVLASVFGLISFTQELERIDRDYDTLAVALYSLLILPNQMVSLAPVIALLGSIVALASLDRYNELTIISCTGFARRKLISAVLLPTLLLMAGLWLCMEYVTPQLQLKAEQERYEKRTTDATWLPGGGVWSTDGRRYIHLRRMEANRIPGEISLYEFNDRGELVRSLKAARARVDNNRNWLFQDVREKVLEDDDFVHQRYAELEIPNLWSRNELPTLTLRGDTMSLSVLYDYAQFLANNGQPMERYLNSFWQRLMMPFTVLAMVLLATPISASVTAGRDRSFGINLGIGAIIGIFFYLGAQIVFALGQLMSWSIPIIASVPAVIILVCALLLLRRMRW